jgi:hypothetical protein
MNDSISFFRRISSQPIKDVLKFYIDDAVVGLWSNFTDTTFKRYAFPVMAGPHTFKWVYEKNSTTSLGLDAAWADFIVFPPQYRTTASAGDDADVCAGNSYQLQGMADSYDSVRWTTNGTGQFSDATILNPVYIPSAQDIIDGMVNLTLTAYGINSVDNNSMMLMIWSSPTASAGGNSSVCKGQTYPLSAAAASSYLLISWKSRGDGIFDTPSILHPTYTPGPQDMINGSVNLVLYVIGSVACPIAADSLVLAIHSIPQVNLGKDTMTCANLAIELNATHPEASGYLWLPSNKTTPTILVDSTGIGLHSAQINVLVTDNNGCVGKDSVMVSFKICGGIEELAGIKVQVFPNPSNGLFTLEINTQKQETLDIAIISPTGETVYSNPGVRVSGFGTEKIDVSRLPQGTYLLQVSNRSGKMLIKTVIQK